MSFGYSIGDIAGLTQLAWKIVQNTRKAVGEHNSLTHEVTNLHAILLRLEHSASSENPDPSLSPHNDISTQALRHALESLREVLRDLDEILEKYNALSETQRATTKLWSKIRFGNGPMLDLGQIKMRVVTYMAVVNAHVTVDMSEDIRKMQWSLKKIAGKMAGGEEGTVLTSYDGDDRAAWRELRRELRREGFEDSFVRERKESIVEYVKEIGKRGFFDVDDTNVASSSQYPDADLDIGERLSKIAVSESQEVDDSLDEDSFSDDDDPDDKSDYSFSDTAEGDSVLSYRSDKFDNLDTERNIARPKPNIALQNFADPRWANPELYWECTNCGARELRKSPTRCFKGMEGCEHHWCPPCLYQVFINSLSTPEDMPPSCCTIRHIPHTAIRLFFNQAFKDLWNRKFFEFTVSNPAYCPNSTCGALIYPFRSMKISSQTGYVCTHRALAMFKKQDPNTLTFRYAKIKKVWTCGLCNRKMCIKCNARQHSTWFFKCASETQRAQNARQCALVGAHLEAREVATIVAQNPYNDKVMTRHRIFKHRLGKTPRAT